MSASRTNWQSETKGVLLNVSVHAAKTPVERIFEKVMHRKMTSQERIYFHLKREVKLPPRAKTTKHKHKRAP